MRNAAMVLGIIGGLIALLIGFFGYGYTEVIRNHEEVANWFGDVDNQQLIRVSSFLAPLLALAGAAMAKVRALWGGILLLVAALAIYTTFNNFFAIFPAAMCGLAAILAIAAGRPDKEHSHF